MLVILYVHPVVPYRARALSLLGVVSRYPTFPLAFHTYNACSRTMKFAILASMLSAAAAFAPASQGGMYGTIRETPWMPASLLLESVKAFFSL